MTARVFGSKEDNSPLTLAVDDTALCPKIRSVWNPITEKWALIGQVSACGQPAVDVELVFDNEEDLRAALRDNNLVRGKKVSFCPKRYDGLVTII